MKPVKRFLGLIWRHVRAIISRMRFDFDVTCWLELQASDLARGCIIMVSHHASLKYKVKATPPPFVPLLRYSDNNVSRPHRIDRHRTRCPWFDRGLPHVGAQTLSTLQRL